MHLPAGLAQGLDDGAQAVELDLPARDIIFLSAADGELGLLADASAALKAGPGLTPVNLMKLGHNLSVDLFVDQIAAQARLVVVRVLGGAGYWEYGLEALRALARSGGPALAVVPGEERWDPDLEAFSTVENAKTRTLWRYLVEGGAENAANCVAYLAHLLGEASPPPEPAVLPRAGFYLTGKSAVDPAAMADHLATERPVAALVFYRALLLGGATDPVDSLVDALAEHGLAAMPVFVASLKERESAAFLETAFGAHKPDIVVNATAFAVSRTGHDHAGTVLDRGGRPVLQVVFSGSTKEQWQDSLRGLSARDLTMNVVLPEVDGRLLTRPVSFKEPVDRGDGVPVTAYRADPERATFVARQAAAWVRLARKPAAKRRVAIVLSNYPDRDGRIANGVGLDTPASAVNVVRAMREAGYEVADFPATSDDLMRDLLSGRTNASSNQESAEDNISLAAYRRFLDCLPPSARAALSERWGAPESDPTLTDRGFPLAVRRFGNLVIGIQPPRGYGVDPKATYHDPDLVPTHSYLAFYAWLRNEFAADALIHLGKHGNLEWLPGKALGLSNACWPEIALATLPLIYPFIVNDPGEGSQAKRRSSAVIVDHLMPPMTRAELHDGLAGLEALVDEYYLAAGVDPRRRDFLADRIVEQAALMGLDRDLGLTRGDDDGEALQAIDAHLCDLKEMQIRDGLHVLGQSPDGRLETDTLVAMARVPRGASAGEGSLHRAIAEDLGLDFDPLDHEPAHEWCKARPSLLKSVSDDPWRTEGDTVERIEQLAGQLIGGDALPDGLSRTIDVLDNLRAGAQKRLAASGRIEIEAVLMALDGRFVAPGPSGAPTRGRPDVLPTGRNFYSVDVRGVPTPAAWELGRRSADALALRYFQDEGDWPRSIAMSAWGTSNMRTGGDDVAHVLALIGARPVWEEGTGRVTGFVVIPLSELGRPRIDVTLRISGMFRDAFPAQIDLIDGAFRAIAALDEDGDANPIAASTRSSTVALSQSGMAADAASHIAATRIFGAKPGAYGAGLQALIDHGGWETRRDFARAFVAWGGFAYGANRYGDEAAGSLEESLRRADAVYQAQDNREHDILDSDDYYQFQGGLAATVETLKGAPAPVYHGDTARPEKPVIRSLGEEIARVVRGRAANPKWIAGVMRHGYKGAFEIAATVDYLFAFSATTDAVGDHHFDQLFDAYLAADQVREFLADKNPAALAEIADRLREAIDRDLWSPRSNSAYDRLSRLIQDYGTTP